jgi:hypothetical protein
MKDIDTKILEDMYEQMAGGPPRPLEFVEENFSEEENLLLEGIIEALGGSKNPAAMAIARRMIGLVNREIPQCSENEACLQGLEQRAELILKNISYNVRNPMVDRVLKQYEDLSAVAKVKILFKLLSGSQ